MSDPKKRNGLTVPTKKIRTVEQYVHPHAVPVGITLWGERAKITKVPDDEFISVKAVEDFIATLTGSKK